jgi:RimJ/RimL family protein N-acetyltransferase
MLADAAALALPSSVTYPLRTPRLLIEPLTVADVAEFVAYRQAPEVARYQSWTPDYTQADALRLVEGQPTSVLPTEGSWLQLAVRPAAGGTLHGDVAIHRLADQPDTFELGVTLAPASQGVGVGAEAMGAVLEFLFAEEGAHRVVAFCDARNEPVRRLLDRVGMRQESRQLDADFFKGEWTTLDGYAILAAEYGASTEYGTRQH